MGGRGSFLESGGFSAPAKWHAVDYVNGIKVLAPKNPKASINLPDRSNTPGTTYIAYRKDGIFSQLRVFDEKRIPLLDIDYGTHQGKKSLHIHTYTNGVKDKGCAKQLTKEDEIYKKYNSAFKGVEL